MDVNYQKLYTFLVGEVDDVLQRIADDLISQNCSWHEMNEIGVLLKNALLEAEERYLRLCCNLGEQRWQFASGPWKM